MFFGLPSFSLLLVGKTSSLGIWFDSMRQDSAAPSATALKPSRSIKWCLALSQIRWAPFFFTPASTITGYSRILDPTFCCSISTFLNLNLLGVNPSKPVRFWKRLKGQSRDLQAAWTCWQVWRWARFPILINHGRLSHPSPFWHPLSCLPSRNLHISTHLFAILAGTFPSRHTICPEIAFQGGQVDTNSSRSEMKGWGSTFTMLIRPQICHVVALFFCLATQDQPDGTQYFRISKPLGSAESWRFTRCIFSLEAVWSSLWSGIAL